MSRYHPLFIFLLIVFFIVQYVSCQLPSTQVATMKSLHELLKNNANSKWNSSLNLENPCSWTGVSCSNSSITGLTLSSFSISNAQDSWSSLVCGIGTLQHLDLSNNILTSIPQPFISSCGRITGLKLLNFSQNRLSGPLPVFQGFSSLEVLDLSNNMFNDASIDLQFDGLNELKSLNISNNQFRGPIPTKLGNSMLLEELQLSRNYFEGNISDEITKYVNLSLLDLSGNKLTGMIPSRIGELSNLQLLLLSANQLFGEIPPSISGITTLKRFAANQNQFIGAIPLGITRYLRNLDLSYNRLTGSIPADLLLQQNLQTVDLSANSLVGSIPSTASRNLFRLRLGNNSLVGQIPRWLFGDDVPSLAYLEVDNNNLNGSIPPELTIFKNLSLLDLSFNNLVGFLPPELGNLNRLEVLQLQHNNLSGKIPDEISQLQILVKLNISWNSLSGSIPQSFSKLQRLSNLDLQVNNLSGRIPESFGTMDSLLELQLGKNRFNGVGSLPTKLQIALNLSRNDFEGPLPSALSELQALEVLDLSNNGFSGGIPSFLGRMPSLTLLLLSNNNLTGTIPTFGSNVIVSTDGNSLSNPTPTPPVPVAKNKKPVSWGIVVAATSAVVVLTVVAIVALIYSRKVHKVNDEERHSSRLQVIRSNLLTGNVIHRSNLDFNKAMEAVAYPSNAFFKTRFSTYYKAVMPSGMIYFVKKLNWSDKIIQLGSHSLLEEELQVLGKLSNSSVMTPLAYALTTNSAYLFYEFTKKGSLFDVLHGNLASGLDWTNRYSIAIGVANGLTFLHGCPSGPIILLDLSSKVIMLKSLNEPQIGDIELAKVIDPSKSTGNLSAVAGSVGYVPPEYAYTMRVTTAGNVYSFGVVLLELLTGKAAVSEGSELAKWVSSKSKQQDDYDQILDSTVSRTSSLIRDQMLAVLRVALACVNVSPDARPKMRSVLPMLLNARN
ncbi:Leucine-rich repeat-containing protein [Cynara cardunculus var. scolymus]|uniref:Leucine-rich repeat-containing protein n=2 Tax=Cynara cardunculus var. scolymus TaxID=59895 RepID=A0A103XBP3_CYNCS|nr:Leucine-rich repeat-containing protein [Cynara cardunculus var. scolymus]